MNNQITILICRDCKYFDVSKENPRFGMCNRKYGSKSKRTVPSVLIRCEVFDFKSNGVRPFNKR